MLTNSGASRRMIKSIDTGVSGIGDLRLKLSQATANNKNGNVAISLRIIGAELLFRDECRASL